MIPAFFIGTTQYVIDAGLADRAKAIIFLDYFSEKTVADYLRSRKYQVVEAGTELGDMKNVLLSRMFPNYKQKHTFDEGLMFSGSPKLFLDGVHLQNQGEKTKLFVMSKNNDEGAQKLKDACLGALKKNVVDARKDIYKLMEWCTVPTVEDVLKRHKFKLNNTIDQWKSIIDSDWFKPDNFDKQSFISSSDWEGKDESQKIEHLKIRCKDALSKKFERTHFPAPTVLLKGKSQTADEFQEAALFCVEPKTAKSYVQESMLGSTHKAMPHHMKGDFCYVTGKNNISDYENIKTIDPMNGKSFWCAVRMIYEKYQPR